MTKRAANDRPAVSYALLAYNQERYVRDAVESALAQTYSPLEIILSDDCSTDRTYEIMRDIWQSYRGPHRIILNRNDINGGIARHVNFACEAATGEFIILAAGDDISLPERTERTVAALEADSSLAMVSLGQSEIDEFGKTTKPYEKYEHTITLQDYLSEAAPHPSGASRGFRRKVYDLYGPLSGDCPTEDTPFLFRALLLGSVKIVASEGLKYRRHSASLSAPKSISTMRLDRIEKQHLLDAAEASGHVFFTPPESSIDAQVRRHMERRILEHLIVYGQDGLLAKISKVACTRCYSPKEKMKKLVSLLKSELYGMRGQMHGQK